MDFRLAYLYLTLAHFKGQGQGHTHFDCEYILQTVTDEANIAIANKQEVAYGLSISIFTLDLGPFKRSKGYAHFDGNISQTVKDKDNITTNINYEVVCVCVCFRLPNLDLIMHRSKEQGQGHAYFDCESL